MPRVVHFEIPVDDPERARRFYAEVFAWQSQQWGSEPYWLVKTGEPGKAGIDGALIKKRSADHPMVNSIDVPDIDEFAGKVEAAGGVVVVPRMAIPTVGWLAYFKDPEGNIMGLWQQDPKAR
jgi:uncharacterized protein